MRMHDGSFMLIGSLIIPFVVAIWIFKIRDKKGTFGRKLISLIQSGSQSFSVLNLLPDEKKRHLKTPTISTLTFYKGNFPIEEFRARVRELVSVNPFLRARLVNVMPSDLPLLNNKTTTAGVCAIYPTELKETDELDSVRFVEDSTISETMPYAELVNKVSQFDLALGKDCVDRDLPLFCVTVIEIEKNARYCMLVSLCHTIGDGFTYYKIYSMLDQAMPIVPIVIERQQEFSADMKKNLSFGTSLVELPFVLLGSLYNKLFAPRMQARVYTVNPVAVQTQKEAYSSKIAAAAQARSGPSFEKPTFLSTNDILTSWFFRFSKVEMGFMIANFRNRKAYLNDTHGGNYQGRVLFLQPDMERPEQVREALPNFQPTSGANPTLPQIMCLNLALTTNWTTFYTDVRIPGCTHEIHLPVIDVSDVVLRQAMVVFQARKGVTGVILWTRGIAQGDFEREHILQAM